MASKQSDNKKSKRVYARYSSSPAKHWWQRLPILLLLLLLPLLLLLLLRNCGDNDKTAPFTYTPPDPVNPITSPYIPPKEPMKPIDPGKIGFDRDSIARIATDRINILLEKKDDNTANAFRQAFKSLYPSDEYQFTYFDQMLCRLQLQVPVDKRDYLMDNLNSQMPQFEFLMFDETVFGSNVIPTDPAFRNGMAWYFEAIHAYQAWDITRGSADVKIAIVDNGFDLTHPDLAGHYVDAYNVVERSAHLYPPVSLNALVEPGHGTHVAGTAAGKSDNAAASCGIAPGCTLIPVQVGDRNGMMSLTHILDGILYSIYQGADVVNVSLGIQLSPELQKLTPAQQLSLIMGLRKNEERMWNEVSKIARNKNATLVFAAGNENVLSGFDAMKRNENTIIVSAVDRNFEKADFSNYGNYIDVPFCYSTVSAPGTEIVNAYPGNKVKAMQGTSMAAPIVAGAVGLMKSLKRDLTTEQIIEILQNTGIEVDAPIGNVIQLDAALQAVQTGDYGKRTSKPQPDEPKDKLKTGDVLDDITKLYGLWKSTKQLSSTNGHDLDVYMYFSATANQLFIVETSNNDKTHKADLDVHIANNNLYINQLNEAYAADGSGYKRNKFVCSTDSQGYLVCDAYNQDGTPLVLQFNLVRIR